MSTSARPTGSERGSTAITKSEFWTWGIAFSSNSGGLNKAHVQWLECALVQRAKEAKRCVLDNGNTPQKPALTEHEEADVKAFRGEMLRILPLVEMRFFEKPKAIVSQQGDRQPSTTLRHSTSADSGPLRSTASMRS